MNDRQRQLIRELRDLNRGYSEVASITGLSRDSVKAYCRNHGLGGDRSAIEEDFSHCRNCHRPIESTPGKRRRIFCSDSCRHSWDNRHRNPDSYKAFHEQVCEHCGKTFRVYSTSVRKFCSHQCYVLSRFGKS